MQSESLQMKEGECFFPELLVSTCCSLSKVWVNVHYDIGKEMNQSQIEDGGTDVYRIFLVVTASIWSSGQNSWLQIQRSWFDSQRYQIF
jgi:hypothetical protein